MIHFAEPPHAVGSVELCVAVAAERRHLAELRAFVGNLASEWGGSDELVADLQLMTSELATNVIDHTTANSFDFVLARDADTWRLEISQASGLCDADVPSLPDLDSPSGRGLFIVHALADSVSIVDADDGHRLRCEKAAA